MTDISIRAAVHSDASQVHKFIVELARYEKAEEQVKSSIENIETSLFADDSTAHAIIAEMGRKPVGMGVYFYNYSTWLGRNGLYLEDLYVSPDYRGLGIGKKMLSHLAGIALKNNCGRMEWSVLDWNQAAIDVYEAMGAKPQSEWIGYRLTGNDLKRLASCTESI